MKQPNIHLEVASRLYNIPIEEVTEAQRQSVKSRMFAYTYGSSVQDGKTIKMLYDKLITNYTNK